MWIPLFIIIIIIIIIVAIIIAIIIVYVYLICLSVYPCVYLHVLNILLSFDLFIYISSYQSM